MERGRKVWSWKVKRVEEWGLRGDRVDDMVEG